MVQFYFLSVACSLILGFILFFQKKTNQKNESENPESDISFLDEKSASFASLFTSESFFSSYVFQLVIGSLSIITALFILLSPYNGVFLFGDLIPAIACAFGGAAVLVNYYIENSSSELKLPEFLNLFLVEWKEYVGVFCIVVSVIHFIIPGVLFF
ncbi:MAG: hypothetical protein II367_02570 [Treponema sp.]|nr:hypothetical protein [Treponema sp.]